MFDTHSHLFDDKLLNLTDKILSTAAELGFIGILCVCETEKEVENFLSLYKKYKFLYCSLGVHPHNAKNFNENIFETLFFTLSQTGRLVAIGETGLDFYYNYSPRIEQIKCFQYQLEYAKKVSLPVIIHSRNSQQLILEMLQEYKISNGVIHCFTGDYEYAKKFISLGIKIGITGIITFKKSFNLHEVVRNIPTEYLVIETDAPYLSPEPYRGKINTPLNLNIILTKCAEVKNIELSELENKLDINSLQLFNIKTIL
ncbi:MAG: TatD family hydrolase [Endomicrobia bacterium]|nr:TatD family hydrolase [Endomicrobiia bacterium]